MDTSEYDYLYENEPWGKLAVKAGLSPGNTESQARRAFAYCAQVVTSLEGERDAALAENKRLRSALRAISKFDDDGAYVRGVDPRIKSFCETARAALKREG